MKNYEFYGHANYDYNEGLDPYAIKNIVKMETKKYGNVSFYELLSIAKENCYDPYINSATLKETLEFMHDYGFGIIYDGSTIYYDYELDYTA